MSKNDGGPAFACASEVNGHQDGMSLRDWFAGQALIAIPHMGNGMDLDANDVARACYQYADAMLAARGNKNGE